MTFTPFPKIKFALKELMWFALRIFMTFNLPISKHKFERPKSTQKMAKKLRYPLRNLYAKETYFSILGETLSS